ncbi:TPA: trypsin-like serine peptidase [Staphylococcus aureus]
MEIKDGAGAPYSSVIAFNGATGFVVGPNTIVTNKHVVEKVKVGDKVNAHPSSFGNSGGIYTVKNIVEYTGKEDLAIVHVDSIGEGNRDFNRFTRPMPMASGAHEGERVLVIGYPNPAKNEYKLFASQGKVISVKDGEITYDAFAESGNSGSPIMNDNGEAIGVHFASDRTTSPDKKSYGVFFTEEIKKFIQQHIDNQ